MEVLNRHPIILDNENSRPSSGSFANPPFPSLYPTDQLKKRSLESTKQPLQTTNEQSPRPEPSAPPLTPLVTKRRPKMSIQPDTMPRSSSLYAALVPRDIPPTSCKQSTVDDDEKPAVEDPILVDLTSKAAYLSLEELKVHLKRHVFSPGPLDKSNRKLYERKLAQLELNAMRGVEYEMKRKQMGFSKFFKQRVLGKFMPDNLALNFVVSRIQYCFGTFD